MKITFINEMADLCEAVGADISSVAYGIGLDHRIGLTYLSAGPGFGGSCFPKDTQAVVSTAQENGVDLTLIDAVIAANDARKKALPDRVGALLSGKVKGKKIAVLGLAFKSGTDDMRDSAAIELIAGLKKQGAKVTAFDPEAMENGPEFLPDIDYAKDEYTCVKDADCVVILTEWDQFKALDLDKMKSLMATATMLDLRNMFDPETVRGAGFEYSSIGRH